MTETLKDYHFTDEQIDHLLRLVRNKAFMVSMSKIQLLHNPDAEIDTYDYNELANIIEDQIVNHPNNF
jgi:hypothetical protein